MDLIKKIWPTPFKVDKGNVISFLIQLVVFVIICFVVGWLFGVLGGIPILGFIFKLLGSLMELYCGIGVILCILKFLDIVK